MTLALTVRLACGRQPPPRQPSQSIPLFQTFGRLDLDQGHRPGASASRTMLSVSGVPASPIDRRASCHNRFSQSGIRRRYKSLLERRTVDALYGDSGESARFARQLLTHAAWTGTRQLVSIQAIAGDDAHG